MKKITVKGKTVEEAIQRALTELDATIDRVEVKVIEEAKKGFLGIGSRLAVVEVTQFPDPVEEAKAYLKNVIQNMGISVTILEKEKNEDGVVLELISDQVAVLIGKRGQMLNALEYLTNIAANRNAKTYQRIILDAENYRERRKQTLIQLAERQAEKAIKLNRNIALEPMPAKDRKIIHTALQNKEGVTTNSRGEGIYRHVVISPIKNR